MVPPVVDNQPDHPGKWVGLTNGSLVGWKHWGSYDTAKECNDFRSEESSDTARALSSGTIHDPKKYHALDKYYTETDLAECIASDDPRLKGN
jgi:hypothetical protein